MIYKYLINYLLIGLIILINLIVNFTECTDISEFNKKSIIIPALLSDDSNTIHKRSKRVRRQYFKPSMDGDWVEIIDKPLKENERVRLLKFSKWNNEHPKSNTQLVRTKRNQTDNQMNENNNNNSNRISVTSLGLSLVSLFDRLKFTICDMIKKDCTKI